MKKTQRQSLPRKLQLSTETIRKLAVVELSRVGGGSATTVPTDGSIESSAIAACTHEKTRCSACVIN